MDSSITAAGRALRKAEPLRERVASQEGSAEADGELWHGTWEGDDAEIRQVDPESGEVLTRLTMPEG
jgi:hypothetical protein